MIAFAPSRRAVGTALALPLLAALSLAATAPLAHAAPPVAPAAAVALVPAQSDVSFTFKQMGVAVDGRFKRFTVQTNFNPKAPQASQVNFSIDLASVSVGAEADPELGKPAWFDRAHFPQATFQSTAIKALGGGKFEVVGKLAIKGNTRDVTVPLQLSQAGATSTVSGGFTLKRLDFKVGEGEWADPSVVANEVQVKFKLALQGVPAL